MGRFHLERSNQEQRWNEQLYTTESKLFEGCHQHKERLDK